MKRGACVVFNLLLLVVPALAESDFVKYRGEVPLDTFQCAAVDRSSLIGRVCYDAD